MNTLTTVLIIVAAVALVVLALSVRIVKQYERGVVFRLGRVIGSREPGLRLLIPIVDVMHRVSLRIVTMPIQSQGIITRDNVSVDVSAVAYFRVVDATKSVVAIENVHAAINQIAQTTLRKVVGRHTLDDTLSETDKITVGLVNPGHALDEDRLAGSVVAAQRGDLGGGHVQVNVGQRLDRPEALAYAA
jgi:regulator of protease activity HflC (stomatin/prohibitin superfamily)